MYSAYLNISSIQGIYSNLCSCQSVIGNRFGWGKYGVDLGF